MTRKKRATETEYIPEVDNRTLSLGSVRVSLNDHNQLAEAALEAGVDFSSYVRKKLGLKRWQSGPTQMQS